MLDKRHGRDVHRERQLHALFQFLGADSAGRERNSGGEAMTITDTLIALYRKRRQPREAGGWTTATRALMDLELTIHEMHQRYGRVMLKVRRCQVCLRYHPLDTDGCHQHEEFLFELILRFGPDHVSIVD